MTDIQAKTGALVERVEFGKSLEYLLLLLLRYSATRVSHRHCQHFRLRVKGAIHRDISLLRVFYGIGEEIDDYLCHPHTVGGKQEFVVNICCKQNRHVGPCPMSYRFY